MLRTPLCEVEITASSYSGLSTADDHFTSHNKMINIPLLLTQNVKRRY